MKKLYILILGVILLTGCDRTFDSKSVDFNPPEDIPAPIGLKIFHLNDGIKLSWQTRDTASVDYFRIYYTDSPDNEYVLWDTTSAFELTITGLSSGQNYLFRVATVTTDDAEGAMSAAVSTVIGVSSISINNDAKYASSRSVSIRFVVPTTPSLVLLSEDTLGVGASWRSYTQPTSYNVSAGDGVKKVFARFRFADGSESEASVSDSIILDTRAFIDSVWYTTNAASPTVGDTILFFLDSGEDGGEAYIDFPGLNGLDLFDDGTMGDATADDGIYSRRYVVPINIQVDNGIVTGHFSDEAGNDAVNTPGGERLTIIEALAPISLKAVAEASYKIRLDWSEVESGDFISYRIYRATSSGVDNSSELVTLVTSRTTLTYTDEDLDDDQAYYYRIYAYGSNGELTNSSEETATTPVNTPPDSVTLAVAVGSENALQIVLSWTQNTDDDFASYQIYRGTAPNVTYINGQLLAVVNSRTQTNFTDYRADAGTDYYYVIYVYDRQGARSDASNEENTL